MNYEEAKKLKWGDRIKITIPILYGETSTYYGSFKYLTRRGYIHYDPNHLAPLGQKVHIKYVEVLDS
jgi:hypothetical protein